MVERRKKQRSKQQLTQVAKTQEIGTQVPSKLTDISFQFDERSKQNIGYGFSTKNIILRDNTKNVQYDPQQLKGVFRDNYYLDLVSRNYTVVPDEQVEEYTKPLIDNGDLKLVNKTFSNNGLRTVWKYETKKKFDFDLSKKSGEKDDIFGVQIVIRNSLNNSIALSAAVRTLRKICENGLTAWGSDFGARLAHYGDLSDKLKAFKVGIYNVMKKTDNAIALLERTTQIQSTQAQIQYIINKTKMAEIYLPDYVQLEKGKRKIAVIQKEGKDKTLYQVLNDFTWKLSRADPTHPEHDKVKGELSFLGITKKEVRLNRAVHVITVRNGKVPQ